MKCIQVALMVKFIDLDWVVITLKVLLLRLLKSELRQKRI